MAQDDRDPGAMETLAGRQPTADLVTTCKARPGEGPGQRAGCGEGAVRPRERVNIFINNLEKDETEH